MTTFSAFTRFSNGARFSKKPPHGKRIFDDLVRNLGGDRNYTLELDSLAGARVFSSAMLFARALYSAQRAGSQFRPLKAVELLPTLEREYGIVPERDETIHERQRTLSAYAKIPRGARYDNVVAVMQELLGDDFVGYITTEAADAVVSHADPTDVGVYSKPGTLRSVFVTQAPVSFLGVPVTITYVYSSGSRTRLLAGDRVIVDAGDNGRVEAVTVTNSSVSTFTATFTQPHSAGILVATGRHPHLLTSKRHNLFVLSAAAVRSGRLRNKANRAIRRLLRAVSTWSLSEVGATPGFTGPFTVGGGQIGITTIGLVPIP